MTVYKFLLRIVLLSPLGLLAVFICFFVPSTASAAERVPMIRMYNQSINDHFYTSSRQEADEAAVKHGYKLETEMGYIYRYEQESTDPIYRMWNPKAKKHFYTTSLQENRNALNAGFLQEGIIGFVPKYIPGLNTGGEIGVYRLYNARQSKHFYTSSLVEKDYLLQFGYVWEGYLGAGLFANSYVPLTDKTTLSPRDAERVHEAIMIQDAVMSYYNNQPYLSGYDPKVGQVLPQNLEVLVPNYLSSIPIAPTPVDGSCTSEQNEYKYKILTKNSYSVSLCLGGAGYYDGANGLYPLGPDDYHLAGYKEFVLQLSR